MMMALNQVVQGVRREDGLSNKRHNATPQQGFLYVYGGVQWTHLISSIAATPWYIELALISYSLVTTSNGIIRTSNTSEGQSPGPNRIKHIRKKNVTRAKIHHHCCTSKRVYVRVPMIPNKYDNNAKATCATGWYSVVMYIDA